ncbi:PepSY domain-containing protein [Lachnoanaerobaculum gingivalis]|uniref:PepSY domain-containing protein n=1 Tax=Lachnoanaerobaculum gingivalis TaxID=2490855 RepID=UPI0024A704C5|nr:PepSY domain-containing protein [Lachnoanaerobaculum gingivalis]WHE87603.1 PepSY domain-containing protein [Lachnoanaerobaculum gingivalis]
MKKFNKLGKSLIGAATVTCMLFAAGMTGVPYYGSNFVAKSKVSKSYKATKKITADEAKRIALAHAKLAEKDVTFVKVELELEDNNRYEYDIDFYSGNVEYDYEIDAVSGAILSADKDIENYVIPTHPSTSAANTQTAEISVERAKQIALSHAGVGSARFKKAKLDYENGIKVYEIEFKVGNLEYEYDINVSNGAIISSSVEVDD